jgi:hypothetical protein
LSDCDWAKESTHLQLLGVSRAMRDSMGDIIQLLRYGYNISQQQLVALQDFKNELVDSYNAGSRDVVSAIDALGNRLNAVDSSHAASNDSFLSSLDNMLKGYFVNSASSGGSSGSGGCSGDDCVPGGVGPADLSGLDGKANTIIQGGGKDFAVWSNSQIGSLIPGSISAGQCPVISHTVKFGGKSRAVKFDFNNLVPGSSFNLAAFMRAVLLISVYFLNIITMIRIFQSGGRG